MTVFFLEDRFSTFDRDLKNKKIMVPMNPEGVHGQPLGLPDCSADYKTMHCDQMVKTYVHMTVHT